jgi:FdhE protein
VCSRCSATWLYQRLQCPFCQNQDHSTLGYFPSADGGPYRLYVCDCCNGYLKAVDLRRTQGDFVPAVERCLTALLDRQAQEAGYLPDVPLVEGSPADRAPSRSIPEQEVTGY